MDKDIERLGAIIRHNMTPRRSAISGERRHPDGTSDAERRKVHEKLTQAGIHKRFRAVTFAAIEKRGLPESLNIRGNYKKVKRYAEQIQYHVEHGIGLILAGNYGTMKTTMAIAILRQWIDDGHGGLIVPMCSLMDNLYTMRILNREEFAKYDRRIRNTPLLVLDDLGGEDADGWIKGKVDSILIERYNKMLPTIITTNLTQDQMAGTYSGRIMDRLKNTSIYLAFNEDSQRREQQWQKNDM